MAYGARNAYPNFDSGYSSSSAKKEKSTGLLGSMKEFFKGRKSRNSITKTNSDNDITNNYSNFHRNNGMRSSFSVSPYEALSPNTFFTSDGVMKNGGAFKPKSYVVPGGLMAPKETSHVPNFEIPVASGPTRQSVLGLFDTNPGPNPSLSEPISSNTVAIQPNRTPQITTSHLSAPPSHSSSKQHSSSSVGTRSSNSPPEIPVIILNDGKRMSPQCSELSIESEDPHLLYKQIHEKEKSRGIERRGSLPNSIISDLSSSVGSERGEDRRRRRRSGPKLIGARGRHYSHNNEVPPSSTQPPLPPNIHGMHPYYMSDPRYMQHAGPPFMPHPHMVPPPGQHYPMIPHPLYQQQSGYPPSKDISSYRPHPQMYPMPYGYGIPSPVMFQPVMEETGEGGSGQWEEPVVTIPVPNAKVKRSVTMDSKKEHSRPRTKPAKKAGSDIVENNNNDGGPRGFDDFNLY